MHDGSRRSCIAPGPIYRTISAEHEISNLGRPLRRRAHCPHSLYTALVPPPLPRSSSSPSRVAFFIANPVFDQGSSKRRLNSVNLGVSARTRPNVLEPAVYTLLLTTTTGLALQYTYTPSRLPKFSYEHDDDSSDHARRSRDSVAEWPATRVHRERALVQEVQQRVQHPLRAIAQVQPLWCVTASPSTWAYAAGVLIDRGALPGYSYCHSCSDYQALMPRRGNESGYDPVPVCGFCIELLQSRSLRRAIVRWGRH